VQETFLKVHTRLPGFRGEGQLRNWIVRIAANEAMNWNRASSRFETKALDESVFLRPDARETADPVMRASTERALSRSLAALGPRHRLAIVMRYFVRQHEQLIEDHKRSRDSYQDSLRGIVAEQSATNAKLIMRLDQNTKVLEECRDRLRLSRNERNQR